MCLWPTFGGRQRLVVEGAPAHWVQLRRHDVAPEVGLTLVAVAAEAQQQQLPAGGDDGGHPVGVRAAAVGHLQLHPRLEAALQAGLHLETTPLLLVFPSPRLRTSNVRKETTESRPIGCRRVIPGAIKARRSKQRCEDQSKGVKDETVHTRSSPSLTFIYHH